MPLTGPVVVNNLGNLAGLSPVPDNVKLLIMTGPAPSGLALGTLKRLIQLEDAEAVGINAAYDSNNEVAVHAEIERFFHYAPGGILYIKILAIDTTYSVLIDEWAEAIQDEDVLERISTSAIKKNVDDDYVLTMHASNILTELNTALAQYSVKLAEMEGHGFYPGGLIIDCFKVGDTIADLHDFTADNKLGLVPWIGVDQTIKTISVTHIMGSDVATPLGLSCMRKISESIAALKVISPPSYYRGKQVVAVNDTPNPTEWYNRAYIVNGVNVKNLTDVEVTALKAKGYNWIARYYNQVSGGVKGFFATGSRSAMASDSVLAYLEEYEVQQKIKHLCYQYFIQFTNSQVELASDGNLTPEQRIYLETEGSKNVLETMRKEGHISDFENNPEAGVFIDTNFNFTTGVHATNNALNVTPKTLVLNVKWPKLGIIRSFTINVGPTN
jgi:hypothetical protein